MASGNNRIASAFGNEQDVRTVTKAIRTRDGYARKFGDDSETAYHLAAVPAPVIGDALGVRNLVLADTDTPLDLYADAATAPMAPRTGLTVADANGAPVVVGNIRMGFGHYRIAIAMASAARAMGYTPYWMDLASFDGTTGSAVIAHQNRLYSLGSRLSQRLRLFDRLYWEPLNSEGFRKLSYNAGDQANAELCTPVFSDLPRDVPFVGTHVWPSQAAVHAGLTYVVNAIPDNWPMALHLAEGAIHTVQTPSAYLGYHQLRGMAARPLEPMPLAAIRSVGHYVDHELVAGIAVDCAARRRRLMGGEPVRYLLSVGGAGAQSELFAAIVSHLIPYVATDQATLLVNVGDHRDVWDDLKRGVNGLADLAHEHMNDYAGAAQLAERARSGSLEGVHVFANDDIFAAVYVSNLLMRACDVLVTKPSEFSFYPVPKLMIHRVGGHEAWGAIRAAEIGDGTYEIDDTAEVLAMIDAFQLDRELLCLMCDNIENADRIGVYDGAYKAVSLAVAGA